MRNKIKVVISQSENSSKIAKVGSLFCWKKRIYRTYFNILIYITMDKIEEHIKEIINANGFCAIGKEEVELFVEGCATVDSAKLEGTTDTIVDLLAQNVKEVLEKNMPNKCSGIIVSIASANGDEIELDCIDNVTDVLLQTAGDVDILWQVAVKDSLKPGVLEIVMLMGFGN